MTTAIDIIKRAYKDINVLGSAETPTADMSSDALDSLNGLIETWANETLMVYQLVLESFPLVAGQSNYTIGPGGDFVTSRPVTVDSAYIRWNSLDYPLAIVTTDQYDQIPLKTSPNQIPYAMLVDEGFPLTTIKLFPTPNDATALLFIEAIKPFSAFTSLTQQVNMPPGYVRALRYNLAMELAPENGVQAQPLILRHASNSKKWLKRTNWSPLVQDLSNDLPQGRGFYDQNGNYL